MYDERKLSHTKAQYVEAGKIHMKLDKAIARLDKLIEKEPVPQSVARHLTPGANLNIILHYPALLPCELCNAPCVPSLPPSTFYLDFENWFNNLYDMYTFIHTLLKLKG